MTEQIFERVKDAAEGTARQRRLFELVRPHEARRGVQGHRAAVGPDRIPALVDQRPLSRSDRRTVAPGRARPSEGRDHRAQRDPVHARPAVESEPRAARKPARQPAQTALGSGTIRRRQARDAGARPDGRRCDARIPPGRARLAARPALHVPVLRRRAVEPRRLAAARDGRRGRSGVVRFNPLFIHATVGLGKTHLLQAIAAESLRQQSEVARRLSDGRVFHVALRHRDPRQQRADAQGAAARHRPPDHRRHAVPAGQVDPARVLPSLNMLLDSAKQVVVAADRPPSELESLEPRVRSRLQRRRRAGDVGARLRDAPRHAAARARRGARRKTRRSTSRDEILDHVARTVTGSGRELEGAFNQLLFRQSFEPQITLERIDEMLGHIYPHRRAEARAHRGHPAHRRAPLQRVEDRAAVEPPHAHHRQAAPDRHVSGQGA